MAVWCYELGRDCYRSVMTLSAVVVASGCRFDIFREELCCRIALLVVAIDVDVSGRSWMSSGLALVDVVFLLMFFNSLGLLPHFH